MAESSKRLYLFDTATVEQIAEVESAGLDVLFPDSIGWTQVLDCRIPPYTDKSIEENCHIAEHVRKQFILVTDSQIQDETPPTT